MTIKTKTIKVMTLKSSFSQLQLQKYPVVRLTSRRGFCSIGTTASITLKDVRLTVTSGGAQTEVSNLNTRMQNFSEHSSAGVKVWYKAAPVNLIAEHSKIELLSEVKFTVKDFNLTKLSYLKNPQNFNVWYNDGAEFLHRVNLAICAMRTGICC